MDADLVSTDLEVLAARINRAHDECATAMRAGLHHALEAGRLLREAKGDLPHGAWLPWLRDNCTVPERTAQLYMRLARELPARLEADKSASVADLSITEAVDLIACHRDPAQAVHAVVDKKLAWEPSGLLGTNKLAWEPSEPLRTHEREPLWVHAREVVPPQPPAPVHLAIKSLEPLEPSVRRYAVLESRSPQPSAQQAKSADVELAAPVREEALGLVRVTETEGAGLEPLCRQQAGGTGEGERTRVIGCGAALEGARTLAEVGLRLQRLARQLVALESEGWQLEAPVEGDDVVIVRPT